MTWMAVDFQVIFPSVVVSLGDVHYLPDVFPRTLDVLGSDFRSVDEVLVNGQVSPSVVVLSPNRMLVQVPEPIMDRVTSLLVISNRLTLTERSLLRFQLGRQTTKVTGILRLVQLFVKTLLSTPGRDIWSPKAGGGALRNLGRTFSHEGGQRIVSDFVIAVGMTQKQIITSQMADGRIPRDEKLLKAEVLSAHFDQQQGALIPTVEIVNQTGQPALASVLV